MRFVGIDPSTKTGFVALDEDGTVLKAKELTGVGAKDPKRMVTLVDEILDHTHLNDFVVIEGFSYGSKGKGIAFQFGLGWNIRTALFRKRLKYVEVSPSAIKKFATGKGNAKKDAMVIPIYKHWNFEHTSDNVRDAYVMAQIAKSIYHSINRIDDDLTKYQAEVIKSILKQYKK